MTKCVCKTCLERSLACDYYFLPGPFTNALGGWEEEEGAFVCGCLCVCVTSGQIVRIRVCEGGIRLLNVLFPILWNQCWSFQVLVQSLNHFCRTGRLCFLLLLFFFFFFKKRKLHCTSYWTHAKRRQQTFNLPDRTISSFWKFSSTWAGKWRG